MPGIIFEEIIIGGVVAGRLPELSFFFNFSPYLEPNMDYIAI